MDKLLYPKEIDCPVCEKDFKTMKVRMTKIKVEKRDSDFCVYYKGESPYLYDPYVCPKCGYSAMESQFGDINSEEKNKVTEKITVNWKEKNYGGKRTIKDAIECYKLCLLNGQAMNKKSSIMASICLRLAWCLRFLDDPQEYKFIRFALAHYKNTYENEKLPVGSLNEVNLMYIIGELNRRLGENKEAVNWFNKVVSHPKRLNNPGIEKMAREQWSIAKQSNNKILQ